MALDGVLAEPSTAIAQVATHRRRPGALLLALRPVQWSKNLLVFLPLLLAHRIDDGGKWWAAGVAFVAASLCASAGYLLNDILDAAADREHPIKHRRPIACGAVSAREAGWAAVVLAAAGVMVAELLLSAQAALLMLVYLSLTALYTLKLKRKLMADVVTLVGLYGHRLLLGGVATGIAISPWLLIFSMFLFTSLALVKRYAELLACGLAPGEAVGRRAYRVEDLEMLRSMGPASGYLAALVLCLYINLSPDVPVHYAEPAVLYLACPLVLYWISRTWFLAHRRYMNDDPVVFALTDRVSLVSGVLLLALLTVAKFGWSLP